ncbi:hypothetical protein Golob_020968 [Gossypium lobatum]|uniref:Uncharacterized protein n=1 Tax=Gossypium lobatum TaxID=34289 RepID=A0A7J8LC50_9ROSI|nr:hypothetical protein [Gossypium lobatum]
MNLFTEFGGLKTTVSDITGKSGCYSVGM